MAQASFQIAVYEKRRLCSTHVLWPGSHVVGRGEGSDLVVPDEVVSRSHLRLNASDGALELEDLDTANGTFVNGDRVRRCRLAPGDRIELGAWVLLVEPGPQEGDLPPLPPLEEGAYDDEATVYTSPSELASRRGRSRQLREAHLAFAAEDGPQTRALGSRGLSIGFGNDVDLQLRGSSLFAKTVAEIRPEGRRWVLTASSSLTSVTVRGEKTSRETLIDGDTIEIKGQRLLFRGPVA